MNIIYEIWNNKKEISINKLFWKNLFLTYLTFSIISLSSLYFVFHLKIDIFDKFFNFLILPIIIPVNLFLIIFHALILLRKNKFWKQKYHYVIYSMISLFLLTMSIFLLFGIVSSVVSYVIKN